MSIRDSWRRWRRRHKRDERVGATSPDAPLREFVYLDAVSLHSLLVSQKDTVLEQVTEAASRAVEAELSSTIGADAGVAKGGAAARYQTSNSNSVQSSRKAIVQTLFKEFRDLPLHPLLAPPSQKTAAFSEAREISASKGSDSSVPSDAFTRGRIVEVEVNLAVDPSFKLGLMMTEWSAMADEWPDLFGTGGHLGFLRDSQPIMRVFDRFLAGLIPIKATATEHVVVEVDQREYVVRKDAIAALPISTRPLTIVGVTEHLGYWKDIRRILFSGGRFTMLCRVGRDGIQRSWTPVKLADLFSDVAPTLVDQINAIRLPGTEALANEGPALARDTPIQQAMRIYRDRLVDLAGAEWQVADDDTFGALVRAHAGAGATAGSQRQAFDAVRALSFACRNARCDVDPVDDLEARRGARASAGVSLFPSAASAAWPTPPTGSAGPRPDERLLDVEVVAIYW